MNRINIIGRFDFIEKFIADKDSSMIRSKGDMESFEEWIQIIKREFSGDFLEKKFSISTNR